jgi:hypothetical protein
MERAFARDFSAVRLHEGAEGARAAGSALAVAAGDHVALSPAAPRPGTLRGDALLAHELAHTAQQARATSWGGGSPAALEDEANAAAAAVVLGTPMPRLRASPLQLRSCSPSLEEKQHAADLLTDPQTNQAAILQGIDDAGSNLPALLIGHPYFTAKGQDSLRMWARQPGAQAVLQRMSDRLKEMSGIDATVVRGNIEVVLKERTAPDVTRTPAETAELARVQAALDADPRKATYTDATKLSPPLRFPVKMFQWGREEASQVYYDPSLPRTGGEAGVTGGGGTSGATIGGKRSETRIAPFIRLGPLALTSDEGIRSTMYHEYLHYRIWAEQQKGASGDAVARQIGGMDTTKRDPSGKMTANQANQDTEILGIQIRDDAARLSVDENAQLLWYLALQLHTGFVLADFRDRAFDRAASAAADAATGKKLLAAFNKAPVTADDRRVLADLKTKITAAMPAKTPAKKK